jgi:hypothetical protein
VAMMDYLWMQKQVVPNENPFENAGRTDLGQPAKACRFLKPKVRVPVAQKSLCRYNPWRRSNWCVQSV